MVAGDPRHSLSARLWSETSPLFEAITRHPFVTGLCSGELPEESFAFYLVQDYLFLDYFSRALAALAAASPRRSDRALLERCALEAVSAERSLHEELFPSVGVSAETIRRAEPAPTTLAYGSYLIAVALSAPPVQGVAAVLPCYRIYAELGKTRAGVGSPNPLFSKWLAAYADPGFLAVTEELCSTLDSSARRSGAAQLDEAALHHRIATRYEWMFWEMAWTQERWPI